MKYWVDTTDTHAHTVNIELKFTAPWDNPILELPVWTPGSYKVRDYSKHVHEMTAKNYEIDKISKNQWQVIAKARSEIHIQYKVYTYDFTVRTSFLDDRYGLLSPASLFFYLVNHEREDNKSDTYRINFKISENWKIFTSLQKDGDFYIAEDFDEVVDSPFGLGHPQVIDDLEYTIKNSNGDEIPCTIALIGHHGNHDIHHFKDQMIKIQKKSIEMFGSLPYDRYVWVLYIVGSGGGGLEHKYSNFSIINRWYFDPEEEYHYAKLMSLEAHEHFHTYNIKRIRPSNLGPFEYHREVYTKLLWVAEGITSFYDNIFLPRTGIIDNSTYWGVIAKDYSKLQMIEGRKISSIESSSFDAWIKLYQSHEGLDNLVVSYYLKGGLVSLILDLEIREQTGWQHSLDTFFKKMYDEFLENGKTYNEDNFQNLVEDATGTDLSNFWNKYIVGTDDLPLEKYLDKIGMRLIPKTSDLPDIGITFDNSKTKVKKVRGNSPAMKAGIYSNDKIIAFDKYAINSKNYEKVTSNFSPKQVINVHLIRDEIFRTVSLQLGDYPVESYKIIEDNDVSDYIIERRKQFLHQT